MFREDGQFCSYTIDEMWVCHLRVEWTYLLHPYRRLLISINVDAGPAIPTDPHAEGFKIVLMYSSRGRPSTASEYVSGSALIASATTAMKAGALAVSEDNE